MCVQCPRRSDEGVGSLETGVTGNVSPLVGAGNGLWFSGRIVNVNRSISPVPACLFLKVKVLYFVKYLVFVKEVRYFSQIVFHLFVTF